MAVAVTQSLEERLEWLKSRRRDVCEQYQGLRAHLFWRGLRASEDDRARLHELRQRTQQFDILIARQEAKLRPPRQRHGVVTARPDPEALIEAVPRHDVLQVKEVETLPTFVDHQLAGFIERQGDSLAAWNYSCLKTRQRSPSRRYEGFSWRDRPSVYEMTL